MVDLQVKWRVDGCVLLALSAAFLAWGLWLQPARTLFGFLFLGVFYLAADRRWPSVPRLERILEMAGGPADGAAVMPADAYLLRVVPLTALMAALLVALCLLTLGQGIVAGVFAGSGLIRLTRSRDLLAHERATGVRLSAEWRWFPVRRRPRWFVQPGA